MSEDENAPRFGLLRAQLFGWWLLAVVNEELIAWRVPWSRDAMWNRFLVHFVDVGEIFALALLGGAAAWWWRREGRSRVGGLLALAAVAIAAGELILKEDVSGPAAHLSSILPGRFWELLLPALTALAIPAAALAGSLLDRPFGRWAAVVLGLGCAVANGFVYPASYTGAHLFFGWSAAVFMGAAMTGAKLPRWLALGRTGNNAWIVGLALAGIASVAIRPNSRALLQLLAAPAGSLAPYLARLRTHDVVAWSDVGGVDRQWFVDRSSFPPIPPSSPPLGPPRPIVILITIDSMRGDLVKDHRFESLIPEIARLKSDSVRFTAASAPGSSTSVSLTSIFTSTYYSQQYWARVTKEDPTLFPHEDPSIRFPEILAAAGVRNITFAPQPWLTNELGFLRGFAEQTVVATGRYPVASRLMEPTIERLSNADESPMFVFLHFLDPHSPYTSAGAKGTPFDGYVAEIGSVDAQIGKLRAMLAEKHLDDRTTIILTADHGEAFGEHGSTFHGSTLYEEMVRVPLLVHIPGVPPRRIDERVSLIDLGPTILDLFGLPTPGSFMGQSLVPFLRGEHPQLTRPIIAEARLKRSLVFPDGVKIIEDGHNWTIELYDLLKDPLEKNEKFKEEDPDSLRRLGVLRAFFLAQTIRRPGYKPPYRKLRQGISEYGLDAAVIGMRNHRCLRRCARHGLIVLPPSYRGTTT